MAEYAFNFGAKPCLIKTYLQVEVGGEPGYIALTFVMENSGHSLRPIGDREGRALSFFAQTEEAVLAQASEGLARRFGPRTGAPDCQNNVASIRHVRLPGLLDDRRASLTVLAQDTISAGDYVVVTDKGATPLQRYTGWLGHDKSSNNMRAVVTALGVVLDEQSGPDIRAAAIAKVSSEVERLHAVDLKQLFRNALHELSVGVDSPEDKQ